MEPELFQLLLDQTCSFCGSYNLHGIGESLLHPDLIKFVKMVKESKALCRITTNGLKLTPEQAQELTEAGMDSVTFSVDAATPETYRRVRRSNAFERLYDNIRALADIRSKMQRTRPKITTSFVANSENIHELPAFVDWSFDVGADSVFIQGYEDRGWGDRYRLSTGNHIVTILENAEKRAEHKKILFQYEYPERMDIETGRVKAEGLQVWDPDVTKMTNPPRYTACEATWVHGIVRASGDIDTCWFGETLGNIRENTFLEIWNGPRARDFRQRQRSITEPPPPCCSRVRGWHYCIPLHETADTIAMGEGDHAQLGLGWHVRQQDRVVYYRFTDSMATAFLKNTGKPYLALRLCVYSATAREEARKVEVSVNGHRVGKLTVGNHWCDHVMKIPFLHERFLEVTLIVDDVCVPCRVSDSYDFRRLGVAVSRIALRSTRQILDIGRWATPHWKRSRVKAEPTRRTP